MKDIFKIINRGIVKGAIWIYCKVVYRFEVIGKENIPKEGQVIICGNHRSFLDPPLIEVTTGRYTRFLAKEELTKNKFFAYLGYVFDSILVKRDSKEVIALKESLKTLKNGDCLALFPEGTRNGLAKGEKVQLVGFGSFEVRKRAARKGRNPQTKEEIKIPASKAPVFKAGKALKDLVNKKK